MSSWVGGLKEVQEVKHHDTAGKADEMLVEEVKDMRS